MNNRIVYNGTTELREVDLNKLGYLTSHLTSKQLEEIAYNLPSNYLEDLSYLDILDTYIKTNILYNKCDMSQENLDIYHNKYEYDMNGHIKDIKLFFIELGVYDKLNKLVSTYYDGVSINEFLLMCVDRFNPIHNLFLWDLIFMEVDWYKISMDWEKKNTHDFIITTEDYKEGVVSNYKVSIRAYNRERAKTILEHIITLYSTVKEYEQHQFCINVEFIDAKSLNMQIKTYIDGVLYR